MMVKFTTTSNCINRCQLKVMSHTKTAVFNELVRPCSFFEVRNPDQYDSFVKNTIFYADNKIFDEEKLTTTAKSSVKIFNFLSADFVHKIRHQHRSQTTISLLLSTNLSVRDHTDKIQKIILNLDELSSTWN